MKRKVTNILLLYGGEISNVLSLLVILAIIARLGTPEELGQYHFSLSLLAPVFMLLWMQQRTILASDVERRFPTRTYYYARTVALIAAASLSALMAVFLGATGFIHVFLVMLAIKGVESYSDLNSGVFLRANRPGTVSAFKVARSILTSSAFALLYWLTHSLSDALTGVLVSSLAILLLEAFRIIKTENPTGTTVSNQIRSISTLFHQTSALGMLEFLYSLQSNVPKYLLMNLYGEAAVGVYASLAYMLRPAILFTTSVFQAALRKLSVLHSHNEEIALRRILFQLLGLALAISTILTITFALQGRWILNIVFGKQFGAYQDYLVLVSLNNFFALPAAMVSYYGIVRRRFTLQPLVVFLAMLSNIGASLLLAKHYGEWGVVIGWILSGAVLLAGHIMLITRHTPSAP